MPPGKSPRRRRHNEVHDLVLVVATMCLVLGLVTITAGLRASGHASEVFDDHDSLPPSTMDDVARAPRQSDVDRTTAGRRSADRATPSVPQYRATTEVIAAPQTTPDFLLKMSVMMRRRSLDTSDVDPYQMSLQPAVYLKETATPPRDSE